MQRLITCLMLTLAAILASHAQEMRVEKMETLPFDVSAASHPRNDLNGQPCALVKVILPAGAVFEGNVINPVEFRTGEYWVYMSQGSKMLMVKHPKAKPLLINFTDYGISELVPKTTYSLDLTLPAATAAPVKQNVEINVTPTSAIVLIDGQITDTTNGVAIASLTADRDYTYTVTARGHIAQQGTFHLHPAAPTRLNVQLTPDPAATPAASPEKILEEANTAYNDGYYNRAMELYLKVSHHPLAQVCIGIIHYNGSGVSQDYNEAIKWFRMAAEQDNARGQSLLGMMYYFGLGVTQEYDQALKWFRRAAEQGDAEGQYYLAFMYYNGRGVTQEYDQALKWFRKSAEQGNALAQVSLGVMYYKSEGVSQDYDQALKWFRKAAEQNNASAQYNLGVMYYNGYGLSKDTKEAYRWIKKAADAGDANAKQALQKYTF